MSDFVDFQQVSKQIPFKNLLDNLNIPYTEKGGELKGTVKGYKFIVSVKENIFFMIEDRTITGSVINFLAFITGSNLRDCAIKLRNDYLVEPKTPKREIPNLELSYCNYLSAYGISEEICREYEVGYVKQKSIMNGKIAFKCHDSEGNLTGYVGYDEKTEKWHFPLNFKRSLYNYHRIKDNTIYCYLCCNPFDALFLIGRGITNVVCLIGKSMTEAQEEELKAFHHVLLLHNEPDNIVLRLRHHCFVKAPLLIQPLRNYTAEEIMCFC